MIECNYLPRKDNNLTRYYNDLADHDRSFARDQLAWAAHEAARDARPHGDYDYDYDEDNDGCDPTCHKCGASAANIDGTTYYSPDSDRLCGPCWDIYG